MANEDSKREKGLGIGEALNAQKAAIDRKIATVDQRKIEPGKIISLVAALVFTAIGITAVSIAAAKARIDADKDLQCTSDIGTGEDLAAEVVLDLEQHGNPVAAHEALNSMRVRVSRAYDDCRGAKNTKELKAAEAKSFTPAERAFNDWLVHAKDAMAR